MNLALTASQSYTSNVREELHLALSLLKQTVIENPYIPVDPTEPQAIFLTAQELEILYGGAAGGGKTAALLMAALQYVHVPGYSALLLRRTFPDLWMPDGLIPLSHEWLGGSGAAWNQRKSQWTFPGDATLNFGYLENERDKFRYKGPSFQFIGFDELTSFSETQYRFLFQRLRRPEEMKNVPLRMRAASNPGDIGHEWVRKRFINAIHPKRLFVPAFLEDNPYLDAESYEESLQELDPVTRRQFRYGDWKIRPEGNLFKRKWFEGLQIDSAPACVRWVRYWDLAATPESVGDDPDWAAGVRMGITDDGRFVIDDVVHRRGTPMDVEQMVGATARRDGSDVAIWLEQEPGSSGKILIDSYQRGILTGYDVRGNRPTGDKVTRSGPFSSACEAGHVMLVGGPWMDSFLDELCAFPVVAHDDQADAAFGAHAALTRDLKGWGADELKKVFSRSTANIKKTPHEMLVEKLRAKK